MFGLAAALAALWAVGIGLVDRQAFILWLDLVAALTAGGIAVLYRGEEELGASRGMAPAALGVGLSAIWLVGLGSKQPHWAVWANFVAACACFGVAIAAASHDRRVALHARR